MLIYAAADAVGVYYIRHAMLTMPPAVFFYAIADGFDCLRCHMMSFFATLFAAAAAIDATRLRRLLRHAYRLRLHAAYDVLLLSRCLFYFLSCEAVRWRGSVLRHAAFHFLRYFSLHISLSAYFSSRLLLLMMISVSHYSFISFSFMIDFDFHDIADSYAYFDVSSPRASASPRHASGFR